MNISAGTQASELPLTRISPPAGWWDFKLREAYASRELLYFLIWRDIKIRYKQTVIGIGWAIIQPLMTMVVFTLFFGLLARIPSDGLPYPIFYYCALVPWTYFAGAITQATHSMVEQQRVITRIYFPRVLLPLAAVLAGLLDFAVAFSLLVAMALFYGLTPSVQILMLPFLLLLTVATAFAAGLWLSALNALYRDVRYVVPFLLQLWLFVSPVAYPSSLVPEQWRWLYGLNPMAGVIEGFRWAVTGQGQPPGMLLFVSAFAVLVLLVGGLAYFRKTDKVVADLV